MLGIRRKYSGIEKRLRLWSLPKELKRRLYLPDLQKDLSRDLQYFSSLYLYENYLPESIREHRRYFRAEKRGFGENAFHAMWFLLFEHFRPTTALEIGVYRGQTITLWKLLSQHFGFQCNVGCVSPFQAAGDAVSDYDNEVNYLDDVIKNHRHFGLSVPQICQQYSTNAEARKFIQAKQWDLIYIDGNHDYEIAKQDWEISCRSIAPRGLIVLDDSALGTEFAPPSFATKGHPGPSRVADEIDRAAFSEVLAVGHNRVFQRKN